MARNAYEFVRDNERSMKLMARIAGIAIALSALAGAAGVFMSLRYVDRHSGQDIYVLDGGSVLEAHRTTNEAQRDLEAEAHLTRFHDLFFTLTPNVGTINTNIEAALELADESAYNYFAAQKENRYYSNIVDNNISQQFVTDSIYVDVLTYPYKGEVFGTLYVMRESTISRYAMHTTCTMTEATRTHANPHGLMINRFYAAKPEFIDSRRR